jgi:GDPmannose 4,6-dehydratase
VKRALITGVTGQDGSYLAEYLLQLGYEVHGFARRASKPSVSHVRMHLGDLTDPASIRLAVQESRPDEVYHLGAQSHVAASFREEDYTSRVDADATRFLLRTLREDGFACRFYQASTSELFGTAPPPQSETTPFHPRSPYAIAKRDAFDYVRLYREAYGMFASNGVLFNHESDRRPESFVTRKITRGAARIKVGTQRQLVLGNLDARRDWGFAGDYVKAMWLMLQHDTPDDFVIATGETHTVREFAVRAFARLGLDWQKYVSTDTSFERPAEVPVLRGDASKAKRLLGWEPTVTFEGLVDMMIDSDLVLAEYEAGIRDTALESRLKTFHESTDPAPPEGAPA